MINTADLSQKPSRRPRLGFVLAWTGAAVLALSTLDGCALLLGLEEREQLPGVIDEETGKLTTELCVEYCDEVMANCVNDDVVYAARASCINTCNALPAGDASEPAGNTVQCRLARARSAESFPDEHCASAGPGGNGSCGSNCEAWCHLLESECNEDFASLDDCESTCESIPDAGVFDLEASYSADNIQCRLIHLGAAADDSIHCGHGRYLPASECVAPESGDPTCARYCDTVMANCKEVVEGDSVVDDNRVYESRSQCMAACEVFELGDLSDRTEDTVGCRLYHSQAASEDAAQHCDHSSPAGDGTCGDAETGNCDSYCTLLASACPTEFLFADVEACSQECVDTFTGAGAEKGSNYSISDASASEGLQCHILQAVRALEGDGAACADAVLTASCGG